MPLPAGRILQNIHIRSLRRHRHDFDSLYEVAAAHNPQSRRELRQQVFLEGAKQWSEQHGFITTVDIDDAAGDSERPFLDFLRELIESGRMRDFLEWLFENLPKLIAAIVGIF